MNDSVFVPLKNGEFAIVDEADLKAVSDYRWNWMPGRGVACYLHNQTILMHNLIAPFKKVSFKNGDKHDCRRENLVNNKCGKAVGWTPKERTERARQYAHASLDENGRKFWLGRTVHHEGVRYLWQTSVSFGTPPIRKKRITRTKKSALLLALRISEFLQAMPRKDFIEFVKFSRQKKLKNDVIHEEIMEWSAHSGNARSWRAMLQEGLFTPREEANGY